MSGGAGGFAERSDETDFFISYAGPDRAWAEWAAAQLKDSGYAVELDVWDWAAGDNFVLRMSDALARAERVLALWSPAYFERYRFTTAEWTAVLAGQARRDDDPGHPPGRLVPVRVASCQPPALLATIICRDLFDRGEQGARDELLAAVGGAPASPARRPFPGLGPGSGQAGLAGPRLPGTIPEVWNLPPRNRLFTGRESLLAKLREQLANGQPSVVQALNGMGGVGKSQLAVEYAHLFCGEYQLAWWIDAERPELIGEQITSLGQSTGWVPAGAAAASACRVVFDHLRQAGPWLIIFDNVTGPENIRQWLPQGPGQVLITSRHRGFTGLAVSVQVETFSRAEAIAFIRTCLPELAESCAWTLADAVGDLPLALAQAAGLIAQTAMPVSEYIQELTEHAGELLAEGKPLDYPATLAAALDMSLARLSQEDPAAVELLQLAAFLSPDPIPLSWFTDGGSVLPAGLAGVVARRLTFRRTLARLSDLGLAQVGSETIQLHRLTQAVLRDRQTDLGRAGIRERVTRLLVSVAPDNDGVDPATWPAWAALLPHLLAADPSTAPAALREPARNAIWYLLMRGEYGTALPFAESWHAAWEADSGPDDHLVLWGASHLAELYRFLGRHQEAHDLNQDTLARRGRIHGLDHIDTLISANNLAINMGDLGRHQEAHDLNQDILARHRRNFGPDDWNSLVSANNLARNLSQLNRHQEAHDLDQDTLERRRRVLDKDHPRTLTSASNLAADLRLLGRYDEARDLDRDTLGRRRRLLGLEHPETLDSASSLASDLHALGDMDEARELDQDTLDRRRRVLGPDHPDTLDAASNLAADLHALGDMDAARQLYQDTLDRRRRVLGPDHPEIRQSERDLGTTPRHVGGRSSTASN